MKFFDRHTLILLALMLVSLPVYAQESDREQVLADDIKSERDSLPEGTDLKVRALEQIRDELDEMGYIGSQMLPDRLYEPEDYVSPEEKMLAMEQAAVAGAAIDMKELLKYVKPLPMKPWLMTTLRMLFGRGVSQRPARWDQIRVPQMGGLYDIIIPGGQPDDSWRDAPPMYYDPHPDKHFRR